MRWNRGDLIALAASLTVFAVSAVVVADGRRGQPNADIVRTRHGKLLISAPSRCVTREHRSDTDHPCIKRSVSRLPTLKILLFTEIATTQAGAARITEWLPVWLSKSEGSDTACFWRHSTLLTNIDFRLARTLSLWVLAGAQAPKGHHRRSEHAFDLQKCGAKGIRTPDLLHAMQVSRTAHQWFPPVKIVPLSARECLQACR
jgi:hypothetical protein